MEADAKLHALHGPELSHPEFHSALFYQASIPHPEFDHRCILCITVLQACRCHGMILRQLAVDKEDDKVQVQAMGAVGQALDSPGRGEQCCPVTGHVLDAAGMMDTVVRLGSNYPQHSSANKLRLATNHKLQTPLWHSSTAPPFHLTALRHLSVQEVSEGEPWCSDHALPAMNPHVTHDLCCDTYEVVLCCGTLILCPCIVPLLCSIYTVQGSCSVCLICSSPLQTWRSTLRLGTAHYSP